MGETRAMRVRGRRRLVVVAAAVGLMAVVATACGGSGSRSGSGTAGPKATTTSAASGEISAQVASYELVAGREQRFLAGLVVSGKGTVVSFGSVDVQFFYLGTRDKPIDPPVAKASATARFLPVAGQQLDPAVVAKGGPRVVRPSEGLGVYEAVGVVFDAAGYWGARITGTVDGKEVKADTAFEVVATPSVPAPGSPAPRTENPTVATAGLNDRALDSRASADAPLPDAELHTSTIAGAIAAHQPLVVVVSTPVYCVSKFCGPITDSVAALAKGAYKDKAVFVHLEVWKDFEAKQLNPAAAEWIRLPSGDAQEPWVFTVGRDGKILERFDNVVSDAELDAAVQHVIAS
jgi:hypothetical protein